MELLVRYAEALGAERFVDTRNVAGVPGSANPFLQNYYKDKGADGLDAIFSHFDLDSDELVEVPQALVPTYHLQGGADPLHWQTLGVKVEVFRELPGARGVRGQPRRRHPQDLHAVSGRQRARRGEHCAWMESSAVIYANSVLGARTNTEGRESTSAAMLTGKIPDWGLHRDRAPLRHAPHRRRRAACESVMDWGMLGYYVGDVVQERIPVVVGAMRQARDRAPEAFRRRGVALGRRRDVPHRRRHAGGRVASRWRSVRTGRSRQFVYGEAERRQVYDRLNANASDPDVDFVMLGCPHAALEQLREAAALLDGQQVSANCTPVDLHVARGATVEARRRRLLRRDQRRGRRGADRHVLGVRAGDAAGHEGGGARLREAGALPAGDSRRAGVVRHRRSDCIKRRADRPLERRACHDRLDDDRAARPQGRVAAAPKARRSSRARRSPAGAA